MAPSRRGSKCHPKPPSDVAAQATSIPDNDSQAARTKNHDVPPPPKKSLRSPPPSQGSPKYITQEDDHVSDKSSQKATRTNVEVGAPAAATTNKVPAVCTPEVLGSISDDISNAVQKANAEVEEDLDYRKHRRSVEKNLGSALNGQTYANKEFVKALRSLDVSTSFTQLMTTVYIVSKIIQSEPMPSFRKKLSTPSLAKKKRKKKESLLSRFGPIPCQIDVMDYEMKKKWDNFQSLLQHVHGEREVVDTKPRLYGHNVVNYILVWYMENVDYPPAPEKMEQGLWFYTKRDDGSSHDSRKYIAVMKQFLDDLIANLEAVFLSCTGVQNIDEHFGKEGNKVHLNGVFKHLNGTKFKYHTQCYSKKHGKSGESQCKKKGKLLEDEDSKSSSYSEQLLVEDDNSKSSSDSDQVSVYDPSTGMSDNEKGFEFDLDNGSDSEGEEDNEC
eukprot:jgi/Psemu1/13915/gm1.13915_g